MVVAVVLCVAPVLFVGTKVKPVVDHRLTDIPVLIHSQSLGFVTPARIEAFFLHSHLFLRTPRSLGAFGFCREGTPNTNHNSPDVSPFC